MSHSIDDPYLVYRETRRRARKAHVCTACDEAIAPGLTYWAVAALYRDHTVEAVKRCERCQAMHVHLRGLGSPLVWPAEALDCGENYVFEWGMEPPDHIAALAFVLPGEPIPVDE